MSIVLYRGRTLDAIVRHDPQNVPHRLSAPSPAATEDLFDRSVFHAPGRTLDQGREGACVPHGITEEALSSPVRVRVPDPQALAFEGYDWCRANDVFPGVDYDGTDSNTGFKWGRLRGWWPAWKWAFNPAEFRAGLEVGPACIAIPWHEGMYEAPGGILRFSGSLVGYHFLVVNGYTRKHRKLGRAYRIHNSWGYDWGVNGMAYSPREELEGLIFGGEGETAFPVGRAFGV